jgi:uncharacterized membrane-anchored protein
MTTSSRAADTLEAPASTLSTLAVKVPEITAFFWVIKILSTAMGEALSDFLDGGSGAWPVVGVLLALIAFVLALRWQLKSRTYHAVRYWLAVAMVATFGTMAADGWHQAFGIPYWASSLGYLIVLGVIFWRWYATEGTLSIHSITTKRRERYYWAAVLATFALGTAVGDMTATDFGWGFLASALVFTGIILVPLAGYWKLRFNSIFAFWSAYIITRPLGASYADWMDVSKHRGGLAWGTGPVSLTLIVIIGAVVAYVAKTGVDRPRHVTDASGVELSEDDLGLLEASSSDMEGDLIGGS